MRQLKIAVLTAACLGLAQVAIAHEGHHDDHGHHQPRADGHAPAGVMFDHLHSKGGWMLGYNAQRVKQQGDWLQGTAQVKDRETSLPYRMYGDNHEMYMHMLHFMYAPTDNITLTLMPMYMSMDMDMRTPAGEFRNKHKTEGWADTIVGASYRIYDDHTHSLSSTLALSAPTGDYKNKNARGEYEPYGMQLGAGVWQAIPSVTYQYREDKINAGVQFSTRQPLEKRNDVGYGVGSEVKGTAWVSYSWLPEVSTSMRVEHSRKDDITASSSIENLKATPAYQAQNYGGRQTLVGLGVNTVLPAKIRVGVEYMHPMYQRTKGTQQEVEGIWNLSISRGFH